MQKAYNTAMRTFLLLITLATMTLCMAHGSTVVDADSRQYADSMHLEGEKNYNARQLTEAMNHYLAGLRISEKNNFYEESCKIYLGIGNLYSSQHDYEMGIRFYLKALSISQSRHNKALQNRALNNLVGASCFAGKAQEGKKYYRMLAENRENSTEYHYNLLMCQGLISANEGQTVVAISNYKRAIDYAKAENLKGNYKESAQSCLAQLYDDAGKKDSALIFLNLNEQSARANQQYDLLVETLRHKSTIYESIGHHALSLACKEEYIELSDSLYNKSEFNNMKNAQFLYEARKSEKTINQLTEEKSHRERMIAMQRQWLLTLTLGAALFAEMFIVVYKQKRQLREAYNELFDRNQALLTAQNRPETLNNNKSSNSILSLDQKQKLLSEIENIMSDTSIFCHCDFNIEKLASLVGSNSRYVSEAINDGYGKNFRTFLNEYRIREAMKRLSDSEKYGNFTIKAVSESVGYKSQTNFIAVFTKVAGMKPSIYQKISRERHQNGN